MSETKPVCNRDAAVPYEQADTATCPHCGHTAREHWTARTEESVAQWERQAALSAARDEVVRACGPLVAKLAECREHIDAAFSFAALHGQVYSGPTYEAEFSAARDAVAALARLGAKP